MANDACFTTLVVRSDLNWIARHNDVTPTLNCLFSDVHYAHRLLVNLKHGLSILLQKEKTTCIGPNV